MLKSHAGLKEGTVLADVGCGTGLLLEAFSEAVGGSGCVLAVELSTKFLDFVSRRAVKSNLGNVVTVLSTDKDVGLPEGVVDVAVCVDVYHHFTYPRTYCSTIHRSLAADGLLVVVDFYRDPSKMKQKGHQGNWALEHVRAGRAEFIQEITEAGFKLVAEPDIEGLTENYVLVFAKQ